MNTHIGELYVEFLHNITPRSERFDIGETAGRHRRCEAHTTLRSLS